MPRGFPFRHFDRLVFLTQVTHLFSKMHPNGAANSNHPQRVAGVSSGDRVLTEKSWLEKRRQHAERLHPWVSDRLNRMSRGQKHPVYDFLFDYYSHRPSYLRRWHPGLGTLLEGAVAEKFLACREYSRMSRGIGADPAKLHPGRREAVAWILQLLQQCRGRPPQFGCFGLHEWAMVYRCQEVRHEYPLRLSPERLAAVVESLPIRCSHYDAFRFFTPAARPLNQLQPEKGRQPAFEQGGCLHANMDLYKWAFKLSPWSPSDLVADTFLFAARIREIDMRASPYDFSELGFEPICIETPAGRTEYERWQREFAALGVPLRDRLIAVCQGILARTSSQVSGI